MGKTIRKFSKKRKQTQNKRKTKGRKPIRRKSVRHSRKRGGNTEIPYEDMKPAYDVRFEVECAAKALDDTEKVKEILEKLSRDRKESCRSVNKTKIEIFQRYIKDLNTNKDPEYSDTEKECELLKQKQYFKACILGQLIDLKENDNIMKKIKKKIKRKGIDESIDPETKKQAYAELIFIRMYTLILNEYKCRDIYWNRYDNIEYWSSPRYGFKMQTKNEIIDKLTKEHIKEKKNEDCVSIYPKMKEDEVIRFNAEEIKVGDVEELKDDDELKKLKGLFHDESEINEYFNTLFENAFDLAKRNMINVQIYNNIIKLRSGLHSRFEDGATEPDNIATTEQRRSKILDNNMQITHLTHTRISDLIYEKEDGTYGLRPIPNSAP